MTPVTTSEIGGTKRQTCRHCLHIVGTFPSGAHVPYRTEVKTFPDGAVRKFHYCVDTEGCSEKASETY